MITRQWVEELFDTGGEDLDSIPELWFEERFAKLEARLDKRFAKVETRLDEIEHSIYNIELALQENEQMIKENGKKLEDLIKRVNILEVKVTKIEKIMEIIPLPKKPKYDSWERMNIAYSWTFGKDKNIWSETDDHLDNDDIKEVLEMIYSMPVHHPLKHLTHEALYELFDKYFPPASGSLLEKS